VGDSSAIRFRGTGGTKTKLNFLRNQQASEKESLIRGVGTTKLAEGHI